MPKMNQKRQKNGQVSKKQIIIFLARNYLKKLIQWAETAKMDLNALKCIQIHIPQKRQKNAKNGKNGNKCQKITNIAKFQKLLNMVKKLQCKKMAKNGPKMAKKWPNFRFFFVIVFLAEATSKNGTSRFHTMFGSIDMHFR